MLFEEFVEADATIVHLIEESYDIMRSYEEIDDYSLIFEAQSDNIKNQMNKNQSVTQEASNPIMKAIYFVKNVITQLIDSITNFLRTITMGKEEYAAYTRFKEEVAKNPNLKDVKITVNDYRKIQKEYDNMIKTLDNQIKAVERDPNTDISKTEGMVNKFLSGAKGVSVAMAAELAYNIACSNQESAKLIQKALKYDSNILSTIESELSAKQAKKFKKDIDSAAKRTLLTRLKIRVRKNQYDTLEECIKGTGQSFFKLFNNPIKSRIKGTAAGELVKDAEGVVKDAAVIAGKEAIKTAGGEFKDRAKAFVKDRTFGFASQNTIDKEQHAGAYKSRRSFIRGNRETLDPNLLKGKSKEEQKRIKEEFKKDQLRKKNEEKERLSHMTSAEIKAEKKAKKEAEQRNTRNRYLTKHQKIKDRNDKFMKSERDMIKNKFKGLDNNGGN